MSMSQAQPASSPVEESEPPRGVNRLRRDIANRIVRLLKEDGAGVGYHLVEKELCDRFSVSRTPVRGALSLLAESGLLEARQNRGYVLRRPIQREDIVEADDPEDDDETQLFLAIARDRMEGSLPERCSQRELARRYRVQVPTIIKLMRQMAQMGLVDRQPGNGWSFRPSINSNAAHEESYRLRLVIEPAALLEPGFALDPQWVRAMRRKHKSFLERKWRNTLAVEFYEMNADFHEGLARASGNRYMLGIVQQHNQLRRFLNYNWVYGPERVLSSVREHLALLDSLEEGDREMAALLMRRHLDEARRTWAPPEADLARAGG
jgi:DNA-binding GntR family transcriptional regulator